MRIGEAHVTNGIVAVFSLALTLINAADEDRSSRQSDIPP